MVGSHIKCSQILTVELRGQWRRHLHRGSTAWCNDRFSPNHYFKKKRSLIVIKITLPMKLTNAEANFFGSPPRTK